MKIRILSDLHLEHDENWTLEHYGEEAVLCAGDLGNCRVRTLTEKLIRSSRVPFYFVLGNHDFYRGEVGEVIAYYQTLSQELPHFHFLHNQVIQLGDYVLAGTPLWTDFALYGQDLVETSMMIAELVINDFRGYISLHNTKATDVEGRLRLRPQSFLRWNQEARSFLKNTVATGKPTIVITHWCPSVETINPIYAGNQVNPYFTTECRDLMGGDVALWIHGHSHIADDRVIDGTRVIRNPKGYPYERSQWREDLVIEI